MEKWNKILHISCLRILSQQNIIFFRVIAISKQDSEIVKTFAWELSLNFLEG
jgi:hypothetical protein